MVGADLRPGPRDRLCQSWRRVRRFAHFYDEQNQRITADHPKVVAALEWMCTYARKYDFRRIVALQSMFGLAEQDPFLTGRQVMQLYHTSALEDMYRYAPELEFGIAPIPQPPGGETNSCWIGENTLAIPSTVKDPAKRQAALQFILWSCATAQGTALHVRTKRLFPAWKPSPFFDEVSKDPSAAQFVQILLTAKHQRPVMPAQAYCMHELERAVDRAIRGEVSPAEALADVRRRTQVRLDAILAKRGRRP